MLKLSLNPSSALCKPLFGSFLLVFLLSANSSAQVYKWVDKNGKVHYSDRPVDPDAKEVKVKSEVSAKRAQEARQNAQKLIRMQQKRVGHQLETTQEKKIAEQKQLQAQRKLKNNCANARQGLKNLKMQRPVYTTDKDGNQKFYTDEERKKEVADIQAAIQQHCNGE